MCTLRNKRTIQQKVVEFMILRIFSKQSIFSLVDILFKDMKEDYKAIEKEPESESEEEDKEKGHCHGHEQVEEEEEYVDPTQYGQDIEAYMGLKGVLTIERIKDIVGEVMNTCAKTMRYEIL